MQSDEAVSYFGITYVCDIPKILPVCPLGPQCQHQFFYLSKNFLSEEVNKIFKKNNKCRFKTWIDKYWLSRICPPFGFSQLRLWCPLGSNICKHAGGHSGTTEVFVSYRGMEALWSYLRYDFLPSEKSTVQFFCTVSDRYMRWFYFHFQWASSTRGIGT